jgi:hypothetical protein
VLVVCRYTITGTVALVSTAEHPDHTPETSLAKTLALEPSQIAEFSTTLNVAFAIAAPATALWYAAIGALANALSTWSEAAAALVAGAAVLLYGEVLWVITRRSFLRWYPKVALSISPLS